MAGHHVDFIAFHCLLQGHVGFPGHDALAQLPGHLLHIILVQVQFLGNRVQLKVLVLARDCNPLKRGLANGG